MDTLSLFMAGSGLSKLQNTIINNWVGPVFIVAVAVFAVMFIKDRAWMKLVAFVGIAAIVGVLVYNGSDFVGKNGSLKNTAQGVGKDVNTISTTVDHVPGITIR